MEFEQQAGGEATGDASFYEQITDPVEQRRGIGAACQALLEGLQLLNVAAASKGIDQGVFSRPRLGELGSGHSRVRFIPSVMAPGVCLCHPFEAGFPGTKKAPVGSPRLEAFSLLFSRFRPLPSKDVGTSN